LTGVLRLRNSINNLNNFVSDVSSNNDAYYFFVGKTTPWPSDDNPPVANLSYTEEFIAYDSLVFGKLLSSINLSPLINNIPWTTGTVYSEYDDDDGELFTKNFYIVTSDYSVYKCIDNNEGIPSTVQPSLKNTVGCFQSSDGYVWKYMFTVPSSTNATFTTTSYVPVVANTFVISGAVPGTVDVYRMGSKGSNYQGFNEGTILNVLSATNIQLANSASGLDGFYQGSSLYLKSGVGSGQISEIINYQGDTQVVTVSPPFNVELNMQLSNISGDPVNDGTVTQQIETIGSIFTTGFFNVGDILIQSDSTYSGTVVTANSSQFNLVSLSNNSPMLVPNPIYNTRNFGAILTGNVSISNNSNVLTSTTANLMNLSINEFVRVGPSANVNIRRISTITNSSIATVSLPFNNSLINVNFYSMPDAFEVVSASISDSTGIIIDSNMNSIIINYANVSTQGLSYILGETVKEFSSLGVDQNSNGVISFVNASTLILSSVNGLIGIGNNIIGQSSGLQSTISTISSYPYVTLGNVTGNFITGFPISVFNDLNTEVANASILTSFFIPSNDIEYIISPTVTIEGDGEGATAYCTVNTASQSAFEIDSIVPINVGTDYTFANVTITAPTNFGSGATATAVVSPVTGHGSDALSELGATHLGINILFDTALNESYAFPNYGSYSQVGIVKNPLYSNIQIAISSTLRNNLSIQSASAFSNGEVIFQPATNCGAIVISGNSSIMQVSHMSNTFSNTGNTTIIGLSSLNSANVLSVNPLNFVSSNQIIFDQNTGTNGILSEILSNGFNTLVLNGVGGKLHGGDVVFDPSINSYANVTSNNNYGLKFNQTSRVTLIANTLAFQLGETIIQDFSNGSGLIFDTTHELDLNYAISAGAFTSGISLTDANSGANAIITFANTTYLKLTGVNGNFNLGDTVNCTTGGGVINNVYPVLMLSNITNPLGGNSVVTGSNTNAVGIPSFISQPNLTRFSGQFLYINDVTPFAVNLSSKELFNVILNF
jgi:hypothetical protein